MEIVHVGEHEQKARLSAGLCAATVRDYDTFKAARLTFAIRRSKFAASSRLITANFSDEHCRSNSAGLTYPRAECRLFGL